MNYSSRLALQCGDAADELSACSEQHNLQVGPVSLLGTLLPAATKRAGCCQLLGNMTSTLASHWGREWQSISGQCALQPLRVRQCSCLLWVIMGHLHAASRAGAACRS